jgi:hypothetical protein
MVTVRRDFFTDDELALIIRRAALLQAASPEGRHSLAEIQAIAAEVGIPPELVTQAAADLASRSRRPWVSRLLFGPSSRLTLAASAGSPASPAAFPGLLELLRAHVGSVGQARQIGQALEWRTACQNSDLTVTVASGVDRTTLQVDLDTRGWHRLPYILAAVAGGYAGLIASETQGPLVVGGVIVGTLVPAWLLARGIWHRLARHFRARAAALRDALVAYLQTLPPASGRPTGS